MECFFALTNFWVPRDRYSDPVRLGRSAAHGVGVPIPWHTRLSSPLEVTSIRLRQCRIGLLTKRSQLVSINPRRNEPNRAVRLRWISDQPLNIIVNSRGFEHTILLFDRL